MFAPSLRFIQKVAVLHPSRPAVLLLRRREDDPVRPGAWDFPGGNVEWGELHDAALRRELLEEVGFAPSAVAPFKVLSRFDAAAEVYVLHLIYHARADTDAVRLSPEHSLYRWFDETELRGAAAQTHYVALALEALGAASR